MKSWNAAETASIPGTRRRRRTEYLASVKIHNPQKQQNRVAGSWRLASIALLFSACSLRTLRPSFAKKPLHSLDKPAMALKMATASIGLLLLAAQARAQSSSTTKKPAGTVTVYGSCGTPTSTLFPPLFSYAPMSSKTSTATMSTYIPTVSDVPTCAQGCVGDLGGCAMGDVRCICSNSSYMTGVAACVSRSCPFGQCQRE